MSKLLFFTDAHLTARTPFHRVDDFPAAIVSKLAQVYKLANDEAVDMILFGGDFYNAHRIQSYELITEAMTIIGAAKVPTYAIIGQHDLCGYNATTYRSSTLAFQEKHSRGQYITMSDPVELSDVVIYPCHVYDDFGVKVAQPVSRKKKSILLAHKLLSKEQQVFNTIVTSTVKTQFNLILSGDLHAGIELHTIGNTTFYNPGALARLSVKDIERMPKVAIIEICPQKPIVVREIVLDVPKGEDVFGTTFIEDMKAALRAEITKEKTSKFAEGMQRLNLEVIDIFDLVEKKGEMLGLPKAVIDFILKKKGTVRGKEVAV